MGDSATQIITPMNPYIIVLLDVPAALGADAGLGTVISRMLPFTVCVLAGVGCDPSVFFFLDLPVGPGNGIFLEQN